MNIRRIRVANTKHYESKDTREKVSKPEREVLRWFRQAGRRHVLDVEQMPTLQDS